MEEISLSGLTAEVDSLVLQSGGRVSDDELTKQLFESLKGKTTTLENPRMKSVAL
jgi:hypothetical protein